MIKQLIFLFIQRMPGETSLILFWSSGNLVEQFVFTFGLEEAWSSFFNSTLMTQTISATPPITVNDLIQISQVLGEGRKKN